MGDTLEDDSLSEAWPKEFSELKELEKILRCNICKEFMKTALITGCSHLFCSYCIRHSIQYRNQCPECSSELYDNQLRPERTLDEVIRIFTNVKKKLLKRLQISYAACPTPDTGDEECKPVPGKNKVHTTVAPPQQSSKTALLFNSPLKAATSTPLVKPRTVPSMFSPRVPSSQSTLFSPLKKEPQSEIKKEPGTSSGNTAQCPVCSVEIPQRNINLHLDECLARANGAPPKSVPQNKPSRRPLPKLALSLMKEKELKSKCKEYDLSSLGDRKALISRIQRYTCLYNSECDSLNPRSKTEIVRQIEREEKTVQSSSAGGVKSLFSNVGRKTDPKVIEEVNTKYLQDNKTVFQKLIENMRERDGSRIVRCPRPTVTRIISDDEDDDDVNPLLLDCEPSTSTTNAEKKDLDLTPTTSRSSVKMKLETPTSSLHSSEKRKHQRPLSPEIQIAPPSPPTTLSSSSHHNASTNSSTSTSFSQNAPNNYSASYSSIQGQVLPVISSTATNSFTPTTFTSSSLQTKDRDLSLTSSTTPDMSQTTPSSKYSPNTSYPSPPPNRLLFTPSPPPVRNNRSKERSSNRIDVRSPDLFSMGNNDPEETDLFFTGDDDMEEEEGAGNPGRTQCASPDLLATMKSSTSQQSHRSSQKSPLTQGGHFIASDSDSEINTTKSPVKSYHSNAKTNSSLSNVKTNLNSLLSNENTNVNNPQSNAKTDLNSSYSNAKFNVNNSHRDSKQASRSHDKESGFHDNDVRGRLLGNGDSDDEDYLQLVQNKRGKRKTKSIVFSPKQTRSKKMKP
uniref:RING-type E3 ubiquitin transferase n=1 Tax=Cacopsylla melanoneura TaxID=428564 RepID=A0A8D8Q6U5_9HEMI